MLEKAVLFLGLVLPLTVSPGPVNIVLAGLGASVGVRRAIPFLFGLSLSAAAIAGLGGYGLALVFQTNALVYSGVKYAGIAYIAYLGLRFLRASAANGPESGQDGRAGDEGGSRSEAGFVQGMLLTALNPKFYIMVAVIFAQFVTPQGGAVPVTAAFILVLFLSQAVWLAMGGAVRHLIRDDSARRFQNIGFGVLLLGVAAYIALSP